MRSSVIDVADRVLAGNQAGPLFAPQPAATLALPREGEQTCRLLMTPKQIEDLLDRIGCLRYPCDLDLLLFFHRHPRAILISERLAEYVGYELPQVAQSL